VTRAAPWRKRHAPLHKEWLWLLLADGTYTRKRHMALAQNYVDDTLFSILQKYRPLVAPFFCVKAINIFCNK
jgi:hypothetical protein